MYSSINSQHQVNTNTNKNYTVSNTANYTERHTLSSQSQKLTNQDTVQLSTQAQSLNALIQNANAKLAEEIVPNYLPPSRNQQLIDEAVANVVSNTNVPVDQQELRQSFMNEHNVRSISTTPNPSSNSGNVFDFLSPSDRKSLEAAYDHAKENNLNLEDVEVAAFSLAVERRIEAAVSSGVEYHRHVPSERAGTFVPQSGKTITSEKTEQQQQAIDRVTSGKLFQENEFLNTNLFIDAISKRFNIADE